MAAHCVLAFLHIEVDLQECRAHETLSSEAFLAHVSVRAYCKSHLSGSHDSYIDPTERHTKTIKDPNMFTVH